MKGKIVANLNGSYLAFNDGVNYTVFPRGIFRYKNIHPLVGDNIIFDENSSSLNEILKRKNELIRPKACNIDQIFLVMSVKEPEFSFELLYKFLSYILMNNIDVKVVLTKCDLASDNMEIDDIKEELNKVNIPVFCLRKKRDEELEKIEKLLENKVSLFMGQTGVGKSSLINLIDSSFERKIGSYSLSRGRGKHQTKEVILLPYKNGFIGDTPGFSALNIEMYKEDLAQFFPGFGDYNKCYFSNCLHKGEKDCHIINKLNSGLISLTSYKIYLKLLDELPYRKERYKL